MTTIKVGEVRYDLSKMDKAEILLVKAEIVFNVSNIKRQIADAKARAYTDGEYADREWYKKVNEALSISIRNLSLIDAALVSIKENYRDRKTETTDKPFSRYFIKAAKDHMSSSDYEYIERLAELYRDNDARRDKNHDKQQEAATPRQ